MPAGVRGPRRAKRAGRRLHTAVRLLDEQQAAYVDAQALMAQGELEQARQAFLALEEIPGFCATGKKIRVYLIAAEPSKGMGGL